MVMVNHFSIQEIRFPSNVEMNLMVLKFGQSKWASENYDLTDTCHGISICKNEECRADFGTGKA